MSDITVIFDMNGVIVDDMPFHIRAWKEFCRRHGKPLQGSPGMTNQETLSLIFQREVSGDECRKWANEKEELYRELYTPHRRPLPGLEALLAKLEDLNISAAVATAAPAENAAFILDGLNLRHYFGAVIDADQVSRGKPDPELFLTAAKKLGAAPERCVVLEDSLLGLEAARSGGMKIIGVTTTHSAKEFAEADAAVKDFTQVDVWDLKRVF